jgi:hypothetical protein
MIAPQNQPTSHKPIRLLPQEQDGDCKFNGQFVATPAAIEKFGQATIITAHLILHQQVERCGGLDYLQVFDINGQRLWFIDDISHVTCLLPSDY